MLAALVSKLLGAAGTAFLDRVLTHVERKADSDTERQRILATRERQLTRRALGSSKRRWLTGSSGLSGSSQPARPRFGMDGECWTRS